MVKRFLIILLTGITSLLSREVPIFGDAIFEEVFKVSYSASPTIIDWDGDGLNDILVGYAYLGLTAEKGTLAFLKNVGTSTVPEFERQDDIRCGESYLVTGWDG